MIYDKKGNECYYNYDVVFIDSRCSLSNNDYSITSQGMSDSTCQCNYIIEDDSILFIKQVSNDESSELKITYEFKIEVLKELPAVTLIIGKTMMKSHYITMLLHYM